MHKYHKFYWGIYLFLQWLNLVWYMGLQRWVWKLSRWTSAQGALRAELIIDTFLPLFAMVFALIHLDPFGGMRIQIGISYTIHHNTVEASVYVHVY